MTSKSTGRHGSPEGSADAPTQAQSAADAPTQAQSAAAEPRQAPDPQSVVDSGTDAPAGAETGVQHFEASVNKTDRQGREVLSDTLEPGETLRRPVEPEQQG